MPRSNVGKQMIALRPCINTAHRTYNNKSQGYVPDDFLEIFNVLQNIYTHVEYFSLHYIKLTIDKSSLYRVFLSFEFVRFNALCLRIILHLSYEINFLRVLIGKQNRNYLNLKENRKYLKFENLTSLQSTLEKFVIVILVI